MKVSDIAATLTKVLNSRKKVGGPGVELEEVQRFILTMVEIAEKDRYDDTVTIKGTTFSTESYRLDERFRPIAPIGRIYVGVEEVMMEDLNEGIERDVELDFFTPAEFAGFQEILCSKYRTNFVAAKAVEALKPVAISAVYDKAVFTWLSADGESYEEHCYVRDLETLNHLPAPVSCNVIRREYAVTPLSEVLIHLAQKVATNLSA